VATSTSPTPATSTTKKSADAEDSNAQAGQAALIPDVSVRSNSSTKSTKKKND
jgi:hypothetical protein